MSVMRKSTFSRKRDKNSLLGTAAKKLSNRKKRLWQKEWLKGEQLREILQEHLREPSRASRRK
jgi:hypothetical protein